MSSDQHLCVACGKRQRRHHSQTCDACPRIIARNLRELRDLSPLLSAAITPGQGGLGVNVSGSREAPVPVLLHVVDLAARADGRTVHDPEGDQTGVIPIASRLGWWVQDWRQHRRLRGERFPGPTVPVLAQWLLSRVDEVCDDHPAINDFAAEVWQMVVQVRVALATSRPPISMEAPCPRCEMLALKRDVGDEWVVCRGCGTMLSEDEYRWHARVTVGEVAA